MYHFASCKQWADLLEPGNLTVDSLGAPLGEGLAFQSQPYLPMPPPCHPSHPSALQQISRLGLPQSPPACPGLTGTWGFASVLHCRVLKLCSAVRVDFRVRFRYVSVPLPSHCLFHPPHPRLPFRDQRAHHTTLVARKELHGTPSLTQSGLHDP